MMWKIEQEQLQVFEDGEWLFAYPKDAAQVVLAAIASTQEKCAQVATDRRIQIRAEADAMLAQIEDRPSTAQHRQLVALTFDNKAAEANRIAEAIRSLKMETGHE